MILPQDKMGKYIKGIFSLLTVLVVIKPILYIKNTEIDYQKILSSDNIIYQDNFLDYINNKRVEEYEKNCLKIISEIGVDNAIIKIDYVNDENKGLQINFVKINLQNSVIISNKEHINIKEEIITDIASYLGINKNMVVIYEWNR